MSSIDEKFIAHLSDCRVELTNTIIEYCKEEKTFSSDRMSISFLYAILLSRWKEFKSGITNTLFGKYSLEEYISKYIPKLSWGNYRYGLTLIDSLEKCLGHLESNESLKKECLSIVSDVLNFKSYNLINETVITRLYEKINSIVINAYGDFEINFSILDYESYYTPRDVCSFLVDKVWQKSSQRWDQNVVDPTSGSGNIVISYLLKIREKFSDAEVSKVIRNHLKCVDLDGDALNVLAMALWFMGSIKDKYITVSQCLINANIFSVKFFKFKHEDSIACVDISLANPPYKTFKVNYKEGESIPQQKERAIEQQSIDEDTLMLHVYIFQYMLKFSRKGSSFGFLIPSSIATSSKTLKVREGLIKISKNLDFYNFDVIPSSLFDQDQFVMKYKILNDASKEISKKTRITQRSSIVILKKKENILEKCFVSSTRMVRWKAGERPWLFDNIKSTNISVGLVRKLGVVPNACNSDETILLRKIVKCNPKVRDFLTNKEIPSVGKMIVPAFARYFIYASYSSDTKVNVSSFELYPNSLLSKKILYTYLNSGLFYWYWRKNTDGFQFNKTVLKSFPVPPVLDADIPYLNKLVELLLAAEPECTTDKYNKGKFNTNFNYRYDLIEKLNKFYLRCVDYEYHPNYRYLPVIKKAKSNSLFLGEVPNLPYPSYPF